MNTNILVAIIIDLVFGLLWGFLSYRLMVWKGRKDYAWLGAAAGFIIGLIGLGIVALIPSTAEARAMHARVKAARSGRVPPEQPASHAEPVAPAVPQAPNAPVATASLPLAPEAIEGTPALAGRPGQVPAGYCPNCGTPHGSDSHFCASCGQQLKQTTASPAEPGHSTGEKAAPAPRQATSPAQPQPTPPAQVPPAQEPSAGTSAQTAPALLPTASVRPTAESRTRAEAPGHDGDRTSRFCPECGTPHPPEAHFCISCGHRFGLSRIG